MSNPKLSEIDFKTLENILGETLGYYIKLDTSIVNNKRTGHDSIEVKSQELKSNAGIMAGIYHSLTIENFGGGLVPSDKEYCLPLNFSFEYLSRGTNGHQFATAWWIFKTKSWKVRNESTGQFV